MTTYCLSKQVIKIKIDYERQFPRQVAQLYKIGMDFQYFLYISKSVLIYSFMNCRTPAVLNNSSTQLFRFSRRAGILEPVINDLPKIFRVQASGTMLAKILL
ncbi:hypothetical protein ASE66_18080 [Bosea sp. Root483D1]|nr:hypothetical protein ASE66_18080 [Bosea sp. Root483D1]